MKAVVVGAGGIGQLIAQKLGEAGHEVVLASRSGTGIGRDVSASPSAAVAAARVDAADLVALDALAAGADVLVNAVNPPYTQWPELWPPMATAFLAAAEHSGAGLMIVGNLYGYVAAQVAEIAGVTARQPRLYPWLLRKALRVVPLIRELDETDYQFDRPFILDSSAAQQRFGLAPTPWRDALAETVTWMRSRA